MSRTPVRMPIPRASRAKSRAFRPFADSLEARELLATVTVNAGTAVRAVDTELLGVNLASWDSNLNTAETAQMVQAAGLTSFRFPGGSSSDDFHFNAPPAYNGQGTDGSIASFIASVNGVGMATTDYGSGSPQEAAAFLAYMNGSPSNTTVIGPGPEWNDATGAYQTVDWKTAGYWASLRAAAPLATDDGLNFLRLNHAASFGIHYWEIGNEEYGSWEVDHHSAPHDPATYVAFAKTFQTLAASIDPTISIGVDTGDPYSDNWTPSVLQQAAAQGLTVGFLSDHNYVQAPGSENDTTLLTDTVSNPSSPDNDSWAVRAADYESLLNQFLGATAAAKVELLATEFNSVYSNPGKQTTSLVNGLFVADSVGSLLETPYDGADVWDLRNDFDTSNNNGSNLYGWRQGGDYGLLGSPGSSPSTGTYVPYPTYFAEQLASKLIQAGGTVVQDTSSDPNLAVYSVMEANGHLDMLVINKSASAASTSQFNVTGFNPSSSANVWQYGEAQDTAQSETTDGHSALANFTSPLSVSNGGFSQTFPAYSMSVLDIAPAAPQGPTFVNAANATPSPVTGTTTVLSALATDPAGASGLTYTWTTTGSPPARVSYSANGTNAASSSTVTFARAGTYTFQVTATDRGGLSATSSVTVLVNQTATNVTVSPSTVTLPALGTQQFAAQAVDQFGNALTTAPAFTWSVASGVGGVSASGLYTAPDAAGTATVKVTTGGVSGTSSVTVSAPQGPTFVNTASATPSPVTGTTTVLSALATDPAGASSLTYTWTTTGSPPARVSYSANGTNAASSSTVTFARAGTYTFQVTATDPGGLTATSSVTVLVNQTATRITVSPSTITLPALGTQQFAAQAFDQFGNALATAPAFAWSVASGVGGVSASGLYTAPDAAGTSTVKATSGSLSATASVTVSPPATQSATVSFVDSNDWGSGFTGNITITNTGSTPITHWVLQFDYDRSIDQIWNATVVSHSGTHYVVDAASWNATIAPGQSVSFGFNGSPGFVTYGPWDYVLNGVSIYSPAPPPGKFGATATFVDSQDWGSGFTGTITITNTGTTVIDGWDLAFDFAPKIGSIWNASVVSHSGTHYVVQNVGYDAVIGPGQSLSFGFNATPGHLTTVPKNYVLNGVPLGGGPMILSVVKTAETTKPATQSRHATPGLVNSHLRTHPLTSRKLPALRHKKP